MVIYLSRGKHDSEISVRFPATPDTVWCAITDLDEHCSSSEPVQIVQVLSPINNLSQYIRCANMEEEADILKLNMLAGSIGGMSVKEQNNFSEAMAAENPGSLDGILQLMDRIAPYEIVSGVNSDKELGGWLVEYGLADTDFPEAVRAYLNYSGIGADYRIKHGGIFTPQGYMKRREANPELTVEQETGRNVHMNEPIQGRISREALQEWLNGSTPLLQAVKPGKMEICYTFVKIPQQNNMDIIFGQENYHSPEVGWNDKFEFCGAYSRQTQMLRLADTPLTHIVDGLTPEENMDSENLLRQVNNRINVRVEEIVGNDRANLPVQAVTDATIRESLQKYREYYVKDEAIQAFISADDLDPQFRGWYNADQWTEAGMAAYLADPEEYIKTQAEDYIAQNGEDLLAQFLEHDALAEEIQNIEADTDNPLHRMRSITQALNQCGAKSVNVTIQKNDVEMTFKVPANGLKGYRISYNTWDIPAADRREFYEAFGRSADYTAEDITKITYGRNTIYEAPPAPAEEMTEDIGIGGMSL